MTTASAIDLPTIFDPDSCSQKGFCPVGSHSLYYEVHGTGPKRLVLINGLNTSSFGWESQIKAFGRRPEFSILLFDNRGVGYSDYPNERYTTKRMANDVVILLDYLGWTLPRQLHVVGVSLGGMIAQELAYRIPDRISSLLLAVTTPGGYPWNNFPPWNGFVALIKLFLTPEPEKKIPIVMKNLYPQDWLQLKAAGDPEGRTNLQVQTENFLRRVMMTRRQQIIGHISQIGAGLTHRVTKDRLREISSRIPKVVIVTGDDDNLIHQRHSLELKEAMPEAELVQWKNTGHAIYAQWPDRFRDLILSIVESVPPSS